MDEKERTAQEATEVSLLIALLTASGHKDSGEYKKILVETFNSLLDGQGFEVARKSGA